jgi:hypothetical protein
LHFFSRFFARAVPGTPSTTPRSFSAFGTRAEAAAVAGRALGAFREKKNGGADARATD